MNPRISVVIAAYNAERHLGNCLASLRAQTLGEWEALACDDASTDSTWTLLTAETAGDDRFLLLRNATNLQAAATRNRCLEHARGDYVAILDADDIMDPERLETQLRFLAGHPEFDFVGSGLFLFDDQGVYSETANPSLPTRRDHLWRTPFFHATTLFRRTALAKVGGYRVAPETARGQDYDLFLRLLAAGARGYNLARPLYGYRKDRYAAGRQSFWRRLDEAKIRYRGFRALGLLPWCLPFVLKPLLLGLPPLPRLLAASRRIVQRPSAWALLRADLLAYHARPPHPRPWRFWRSLAASLLFSPGYQATALFRLSHWLYHRRWRRAAHAVFMFKRWLTGIEIHPAATIGPGLRIHHGLGLVVGGGAVLGANCRLYQGVTLGTRDPRHGEYRYPILDGGVEVYAGAKILGPIRIGENARIGANAVVLEDVPAGAIAIGIPAKIRAKTPTLYSSTSTDVNRPQSTDIG